MSDATDAPELLDVKQIEERTGLKPRTLYRWIERGWVAAATMREAPSGRRGRGRDLWTVDIIAQIENRRRGGVPKGR